MKKILHIAFVAAFAVACYSTAVAQKGEVKFDINYNYSLPMGNFKNNIISNGSAGGANGELMFGLSNTLSVGGGLGFQDYYQKYPRAVYQTGSTEATSGVLSNSIQTIPLLAKITYSPLGGKAGFIQPYITGGAGISFVNFQQYLGEFGGTYNATSFAAQAGAGVFIPFGKLSAAGVRLGADYNYVPYNKEGFGSLNTLDIRAGVYFPLR